jgi:hypothetical protein
MAGSGAHSMACDECMALSYVGEIAREYHVGFIGNFHVNAALFEETEEPVADVQRCLAEGKRFPGYVFGLGGPLTRHIHISRLEEAVAAFLSNRDTPGRAAAERDHYPGGTTVLQSKEER